jgi:hypothetical protein
MQKCSKNCKLVDNLIKFLDCKKFVDILKAFFRSKEVGMNF